MNKESMTDDMQALRRLLGDAPVVTPDALTVGLGWVMAQVKACIADKGSGGQQEWGTAQQVAKLYGVERAQANEWLNMLVEQGKVRRWQSDTQKGTKGHMRYNLADIASAWAVDSITGERGTDGKR